jgi:hypothetical protein
LCAVLEALVFPNFLAETNWDGFPWAVQLGMKILWKAGTWPWGLATIAFLGILVVRMRYQRKAWAAAFGLGLVIGAMVTRALHS